MTTRRTQGGAANYRLPGYRTQQPSSTSISSGSTLPRTIDPPATQKVSIILAFTYETTHIAIMERLAKDLHNWRTLHFRAFLAILHRNILSFRRPNGTWDTEAMPSQLYASLGRVHPDALHDYLNNRLRMPHDFLVDMLLIAVQERAERGQPNIILIGFPGAEAMLQKFCERIAKPEVIIGFTENPRLSVHGFMWAAKPEYSETPMELDIRGLNEDNAYGTLQAAFMAMVFPRKLFPFLPSKAPYLLKRDSMTA